MSEETTPNSAESKAVEPVAAPAPATPSAPAPEAAAQIEGAPKKDAKRDIFAEIGGGEEEIKIHKAKGSKNITRGVVHVTA
ncbi:MAG: 30S ribosomal protein S11, partial [Luteolibacter sp.]